jgi:hypothetical protein
MFPSVTLQLLESRQATGQVPPPGAPVPLIPASVDVAIGSIVLCGLLTILVWITVSLRFTAKFFFAKVGLDDWTLLIAAVRI